MSTYTATIKWNRGDQDFLSKQYSRGHQWEFDGGAVVPASASPHIVPEPWSVPQNVDPEEAFVAALSSCHMLFFLSLAAKSRFVVDTYHDTATGLMGPDAGGKLAMTRVTLKPVVSFSGEKRPSVEQVRKLHHLAHEHCTIANSVKTEVVVQLD